MDVEWARGMRAACERVCVPFFFKQSAAPRTEMGTSLDGETLHGFPVMLDQHPTYA
jgi:protein gp37